MTQIQQEDLDQQLQEINEKAKDLQQKTALYKSKTKNKVSQQKRNWLAFYSVGFQITELLILYNIFDQLFFQYLIISPLILTVNFLIKKLVAFSLLEVIQENNTQSIKDLLFGFIPKTITYEYVERKAGEGVFILSPSVIQIIHVFIYNNDQLSYLIGYSLGILSFAFFDSFIKHVEYKKNYLLLLRAIEKSIGMILIQISFLKLFSFSWIVITTYFLVVFGIGQITKKKLKILIFFMGTLFVGINPELRDNKQNRKYNHTTLTENEFNQFVILMNIILINVFDLIFYDQNTLIQMNLLNKILMILFIPTSITIVYQYYRYLKYKSHIGLITIENKDVQNINTEQMLEKFLTFKKHETYINYKIIDVSYEVIQPLISKLFSDQQFTYVVNYSYNNQVSTIDIKRNAESDEYIQVISNDLQFYEMVLNSLTKSEFYQYNPNLIFQNRSETPIDLQIINSLFLRYYELSYSNLTFTQGGHTEYPFANCRQIKTQIAAFNKHIQKELTTNPMYVIYDLYA